MIVKRINFFLVGIIIVFGNFARTQELLPELYDSTEFNRQLLINGGFFHHSTSLTNELTNKFIFGGEINDELSQSTFDNHNDYNRIGGGAYFRMMYKSNAKVLKSKPNWGWMIDVSNEIHVSSDYSSDFIGLALLGNSSFLGESLSFSNSSAEIVHYLSVGAGVHNRKSKNFISLNVILPQNYTQIILDRANLTFSDDGSNVDMRLQGEFLEAATSPYFKGIGAALNFDFNLPFGNANSFNGIMKITGRNIGAYHLENTTFQNVDATISYNGFQINDFTNDSEFASLKDTLGVVDSEGSATRLLPGFIQVGKIASLHSNKKIQSTFGVRMYTNFIYRPLVYLGLHYQPLDYFSLGTQGSYGGYGNFRLGLYANYSGEHMMIGIGTEDILGSFLKNQYGQSGLIRLAWKF